MDDERRSHGGDVELVAEVVAPRRRVGLLLVNVAVVAAAAVAGLFVLASRDDRDAEPPETTVPPSSTSVQTIQEVLAILPASPIDGKQSQWLPVAVLPQSDLVDGQVVSVAARASNPASASAPCCASPRRRSRG